MTGVTGVTGVTLAPTCYKIILSACSCLVADLNLVTRPTLVTGVTLVASCFSKLSYRILLSNNGAYSSNGC